MITEDHLRAEVTFTGTLSCIDGDGARPLTPDEFNDVMDGMADHFDDEAEITDACTWGQAITGDMEIYFLLADPVAGPELNRRIADVIRRMSDAVGLVWANGPERPSRTGAAPLLAQRSQRCDLVPVGA